MEEGVLPLNTVQDNDSFMDLDIIDELLLEGCWLEANGSEFPHFDSSTPILPFGPSFSWPTPDATNSESVLLEEVQDGRQRLSFPENLSFNESQGQQEHTEYSHDEISKWWIGPRASTTVMDRLIQALGYIRNCSRDKDVLIQVWVPVNSGGKRVLTTNNQPFSLDLNCPSLTNYREISVNYHFPAEEDSDEAIGLPGRVFRNKVPEWTPDVRYYTRDEYPRVSHAQKYDVRGTLVVPVLEQGSRNCLGVIEVVLTTQKIQYRPELESVCKALEAVDLRTAELSSGQDVKTCDVSYQAALPEIIDVLRSACTTHGLPLAQTWVSCVLQGKEGCWHSDDNLKNCVSPMDSACYLLDSRIQGFQEACSEYHLLKGQGVVGRAFRTNQPCFSPDVTACCKEEYPLSHHARMFGLKAAVAIRLRSTCTGSADFVLEFFLPIEDFEEQKKMLTSLSKLIQNACRTLRIVTDKELQEESTLADDLRAVSPCTLTETEIGFGQTDSKDGMSFIKNASSSGRVNSFKKSKAREKRRSKAEKTITLQVLRQNFAGTLKDAATNLGVCPTTLKRICRHHGIQRWPSRTIKKVGHSLQKIQRVIDSVQGASSVVQIEPLYSNFNELTSRNISRTTPESNPKSPDSLKPTDKQPETSSFRPPAAESLSPSSSCSQTSSSSQCCSNGANPNIYSSSPHEDEPADTMFKRATSDGNLNLTGDGLKLIPALQINIGPENVPPAAEDTGHRDGPRVKVTYGEDAVRFRMRSDWRYKDLLQEISRRFRVDNPEGFHLKYLDDDAEWVLLTCDADLEECIDLYGSSPSQTIRFVFLRNQETRLGRSFEVGGTLSL